MAEPRPAKFEIRLPLLLAGMLAVGMFIGQKLPRDEHAVRFAPADQSSSAAAGTLDEILRYVQAKYVDSVGVEDIKVGAIRHLLEQLDPHSVYISPEELAAVEDDMSGQFEGIGVEFILLDDTIQVVSPISGGPAEAAGILAGDKIVTIEDSLVAGVRIETGEIYKRLRGPKGSQVRLGILRGLEKTLRPFTLVRDVIPVKSVDIAYMLDDQTGYIKINRFSAQTYQEFMESLRPLVEERGLRNLVLDLRGNPGGYLNEAVDLLSQFFPEDKLLVYTQGRTEERRNYKSNGRARFKIDNIAVLIDEGSASASEIVAGAVQDHDRGWVIGRRSFGKGLVQEQYPLADGGALRLTVARYYTPSGRCIQREYKNDNNYDGEAERRLRNGELSDAGKIHVNDSTQYYTGTGRIVYGGGGITPDVFVPLDTSAFTDYLLEVRQHLPQFAARFMETTDRAALPGQLSDFIRTFAVSDELLGQFEQYAQKQTGKKAPARLKAETRHELKTLLKARIAKILFHDEGLYGVLNADDPAIDKAIQILRSGQPVAKKQ